MIANAFVRRSRVAGLASLGAWVLLSGCAAHRAVAKAPQPKVTPPNEESEPAAPEASPADAAVAALQSVKEPSTSFRQVGEASFYSSKFQGRRTASGEGYDMHALTAAHRTLPLGSYVRVSNLSKTKSVVVRINDRGPFVKSRVIDLSFAAASLIGLQQAGRTRVLLEPVKPVALKLAQPVPAHGASASVKTRARRAKAVAQPVTLHISRGRHHAGRHKR